jgi:2-oxoglutarate ferredoxin oxidoreductase subunit alpha
MQAKWGSHGDYQVIALSPWSVQELYDQTINAFNLAERFRVPVFVMAEEATAHLHERIEVGAEVELFNREKKPGAPPFGTEEEDGVPPMPAFGDGEKLLITGSTHDEWGVRKITHPDIHRKLMIRLHQKILNRSQEIIQYDSHYLDDAQIAVICYGFTARSALFAVEQLRREGKKIGVLRLKTLWPFADELIKDIGSRVGKIFVPEMNMGQLAGEVMKYATCDVISYGQVNGEIIHPHTIMEQLGRLV